MLPPTHLYTYMFHVSASNRGVQHIGLAADDDDDAFIDVEKPTPRRGGGGVTRFVF